jgi:hypothetical protein
MPPGWPVVAAADGGAGGMYITQRELSNRRRPWSPWCARAAPSTPPDPAFRFQPGDTAVLVGERETLDRACAYFRTRRDGQTEAPRAS